MATMYMRGKDERLVTREETDHQRIGSWDTEHLESNAFWDLRVRQYNADGWHIGVCNARVHENFRISTSPMAPQPGMVFMLNGAVATTAVLGVPAQQLNAGEHMFFVNPYSTVESRFNRQQLQAMMITFSPARFTALAEQAGPAMSELAGYVNGDAYRPAANMRITPRMQALITEILHCKYEGGWRHLYLQAKALELLALQCQQREAVEEPPAALRPGDLERIHHARELLLADIQQPPTLSALARRAGLNEFKLKTGFKAVFGNTVFGYLKDHRLTLARELILGGNKTVTEVAYETGYSTLQHFSNEFRKKFGVSPGRI